MELPLFYDPALDAYLRVEPAAHGYDVIWHLRAEPARRAFVTSAPTEPEARAAFSRALQVGYYPEEDFDCDRQKQSVYDWENDAVKPFQRRLTPQQARLLARRVAEDYGMQPVPRLLLMPECGASDAQEETGLIRFGHRDNIALLHELAHLLRHQRYTTESLHAHHSPSFVWTAIELYHRYAGVPLELLEATAMEADIVGDRGQACSVLSSLRTGGMLDRGSRPAPG